MSKRFRKLAAGAKRVVRPVYSWVRRHPVLTIVILFFVTINIRLATDWQGGSEFTHQHYRLLLWFSILPGTLASGSFIAMHRPSKWLDSTAINASGWLIIVFLFYARSLVTLITRRDVMWRGMPNAMWAIGIIIVIDYLLILRLISFMKYRRAFRRRQAELERELIEQGIVSPAVE
jgi:hypothetical protein